MWQVLALDVPRAPFGPQARLGCAAGTGPERAGQASPCWGNQGCAGAGRCRNSRAASGACGSRVRMDSSSPAHLRPCPCTPTGDVLVHLSGGRRPCTPAGSVLVHRSCGVCHSLSCPPCPCCRGGWDSHPAPVPCDQTLICGAACRTRKSHVASSPCRSH